jgi:hypothetical protein
MTCTAPTIAAVTSTIYSELVGVKEGVGAYDVSDDVLMGGLMSGILVEEGGGFSKPAGQQDISKEPL